LSWANPGARIACQFSRREKPSSPQLQLDEIVPQSPTDQSTLIE
jgi:hypothetical protein